MMLKKMKLYPGKLITTKLLYKYAACVEDVLEFEKIWPKGVRLTLGNLHRAAEAGLDVLWLLRWQIDWVIAMETLSDAINAAFKLKISENEYSKFLQHRAADKIWEMIRK